VSEEKVLTDATVCFLVKDGKMLLAMKADKIGKGCFNGYGGGIDNRESPRQSAIRELEEESGVVTSEEFMEKVAIVNCHNTKSDGETFICIVHFLWWITLFDH
jgi:8-oxo-dGTP diphosphatase